MNWFFVTLVGTCCFYGGYFLAYLIDPKEVPRIAAKALLELHWLRKDLNVVIQYSLR